MDSEDASSQMPLLQETVLPSFAEPRGEMTSAKNVRGLFPAVIEQKMSKPKYNLLAFFHCAFKVLALVLYLVANFVDISYTLTFVLITILLSADFWMVKNVSGRLLAGLRWWNVVDEQSGNQMSWRYESWTREDRQLANRAQVHIFWLGLIVQEIIWVFLSMVALFSFKLNWLILSSFALALNSANLYGYVKCKLFSGQSRDDNIGFGWTQPNSQQETATKFVLRKVRELFSSNQRSGYTQGQTDFMETF